MAKSKQRKRRQKHEQAFYEALPLVLPGATSQTKPYDWRVAKEVGGAIWSDVRGMGQWSWRLIWNRRARAAYLAIAATGALVLTVGGLMFAASTYAFYASDLASPAALMAKKQVGTTILDRNGKLLYEAYGAQHTTLVSLKDVPQTLRDATLAAEDPNFYTEPGISWRGMARAAVADVTHMGKVQGGSTLTQQLIKNSVLTSDKSFVRKLKEIVLATNLEERYSKDQILEMYLNETYYGQGADGIEAASQTYFHKPASQLTLGESALVAGLPLAPSSYDPTIDPTAATNRRNFVLDRMAGLGKITTDQAKAAKAEPVVAYPQTHPIKAPWFVFYVLNQLKTTYGQEAVEKGGLTVQTTLDLDKEEQAEQIVASQINRLQGHNLTNGSLVSLEPGSGDIIAMVGSANYNAPGWGAFNVAADGLRQPGSSFKPFAYLTAFEKGWTGATTIQDTPLSVPNGDGTNYVPLNYDLRFHGTVTVRHALDNSLNIPAVKTLQFAGIASTLKTAKDMGITTLGEPSDYGLSLVLGSGDVKPLDMAVAYATIANGGTKVPARSVLKVSNRYGKDMTKASPAPTKNVIDARYAYMMTNILSDNRSRTPEFPFNSPLRLTTANGTEIPAAAKTGTTNDFRDNWTVGYTPGVVTAVWAGNSNNSPMYNVDGITGAAPIWHDYMEYVLSGTTPQAFAMPAGLTTATVCLSDGGLANAWDTSVVSEIFPTTAVPTKQCSTKKPEPSPSPLPSADDLKAQIEAQLKQIQASIPTPTRRGSNPFGF